MGEGFRLPGEAQKIDRIMHAFALHYTESVDNKVFASSGYFLFSSTFLFFSFFFFFF